MTTNEACVICGSTRSRRVSLYGQGVVCAANANGRNRCREREIAKMIAEAEKAMTRPLINRGSPKEGESK